MEFVLGDHILYSHEFSDSEGVDITKSNVSRLEVSKLWLHRQRENNSTHEGLSTGGTVDKRSPPTSVIRVRFQSSPIQVGEYVVGSRLALRVLLRDLRFSFLLENQRFRTSNV